MKVIILLLGFATFGCASKPICANSDDGFRPIFDPGKNCSVRIRQVIVGSDLDLPKSLAFKTSETQWSYRWVETSFHNGLLELGHFVLIPASKGDSAHGD